MAFVATSTLYSSDNVPFTPNELWVREFTTEPAKVSGDYAIEFELNGSKHLVGCRVEMPCYVEEVCEYTTYAKGIAYACVNAEIKLLSASMIP